MKGKLAFVVGTGVGYLLGTRAGRQQFDKIKSWASETWNDPRVQGYVKDAEHAAADFAKTQGGALKDKAASTFGGSKTETEEEPPTWQPADGALVDADDANPDTPRH